VLLEAGADALVGNTAGETPLYIAALRGHLGVVEVLLGHLAAVDVDWTQRQLYGDAWTPLMAAAVANRVRACCCCCCRGVVPPGAVACVL
jgi:ankyrin repeat protein